MEWTVLVYMSADNNLEQYGVSDMNEMEKVGTTDRVKIVVQMDRGPGNDTTNGDWTNTRRYLVTADNDPNIIHSTLLQDMEEVDMGDPASLSEFIQWGKENYPANHYCVIVWGHGSGWRSALAARIQSEDVLTKEIAVDDTNSSSIKTVDLPLALESTPRLDLVAFDACLMQMTEIVYEMRNCAGVVVGSEGSPDADGFPYDKWIGRLAANPTMSVQALGATIVSEYVDFYTGRLSVTESAVSTDALDDVVAAADQLATALIPHAASNAAALASARNNCQSYDYAQYKDLLDYAQEVSQRLSDPAVTAAANAVATAVGQAVIAESHAGTNVSGSHGLSIWIPDPTGYTQRRSGYSELQFSINTSWDEFLASQTQ